MIINLMSFEHSIKSKMPFDYFLVNDFLSKGTIEALYQSAPFHDLSLTVREEGSDKRYHLYNCELIDHMTGSIVAGNLSPLWDQLMKNILSPEYKQAISQLLGENVNHCHIQSMLKVYRAGGYISMHTDDKEVALTHLLFLNPNYHFKNKGNLNLHDKSGDKIVSIPPYSATSVVFARSDDSLHSVEPCTSSDQPKVTLQVVFWKNKLKRNLSGRQYL